MTKPANDVDPDDAQVALLRAQLAIVDQLRARGFTARAALLFVLALTDEAIRELQDD